MRFYLFIYKNVSTGDGVFFLTDEDDATDSKKKKKLYTHKSFYKVHFDVNIHRDGKGNFTTNVSFKIDARRCQFKFY